MKAKKCVVWILLAAILLLAACGQKNVQTTWQEQYQMGVKYLNDMDYQQALLAFKAAISIDPKQPAVYSAAIYTCLEIADNEDDAAHQKALEEAVTLAKQAFENTEDRLFTQVEKLLTENDTDAAREILYPSLDEEAKEVLPQHSSEQNLNDTVELTETEGEETIPTHFGYVKGMLLESVRMEGSSNTSFYYDDEGILRRSCGGFVYPDVRTGQLMYSGAGFEYADYSYDSNGQLAEILITSGDRYWFEYDADGRLSAYYWEYPEMMETGSEIYHYDDLGRLVSTDNTGTFSHGSRHEFSWNEAGQLVREVGIDGDDFFVDYDYNEQGYLCQTTYGSYNGQTTYEVICDEKGRIVTPTEGVHYIWAEWGEDEDGNAASIVKYDNGNWKLCTVYYPDGSGTQMTKTYYLSGALYYYCTYDTEGRWLSNGFYEEDGTPNGMLGELPMPDYFEAYW